MFDAGADADAISSAMADGADGSRLPLAVAIEEAARERVADAADKMARHGFPEAADENLVGWHDILARILSVQFARPVGYRLDNVMGVLNAIRQTKGHRRSDHSLFFIAAKAYRPKLTADQQRWFDAWVGEVRDSIRRGEATYLRDPSYDRTPGGALP